MDNDYTYPSSPRARTKAFFFVCVFFGLALFYQSAAPSEMIRGTVVDIPKGAGLNQASSILKDAGIIRSERLFKIGVVLRGGSRAVKSGQYLFSEREWSPRVSYRLSRGIQGFPLVKVTIPEGTSVRGISQIINKVIPSFDTAMFVELAKPYEGYLFPDTYFWATNVIPEQVIRDMKAEFDNRMSSISEKLSSYDRPLSDVIKMAALLEREATSSDERKIVAGILWKRFDEKMALQVDAAFEYFLDKPAFKLTSDDLAVESPYNLYKNRGLGPTPIVNPGIEAITDAITPTRTPYWYYLSDEQGNIHYAETFEGHIANKNKYIK